MCGIAAVLSPDVTVLERIGEMVETLVHRGPDDGGCVVLRDDGVALGMRRLSILDIEDGSQPMWDEERRHCVVFNGEIYNFAALRQELEARGHIFVTDHSDTEVLVHGYEEWGAGLFPRLNGMFAVALWDRHKRELVVARDRLGKKPLYVAKLAGGGLAIASELKALLVLPGVSRRTDLVALEQYLAFDYVVSPRTMLEGVSKLPAAHWGTITIRGLVASRYWSPSGERRTGSEAELLAEFDELLDESVRMRMLADVPVGLFLSGGLDSSTVGYYMRRHSDYVRSFSIGFENAEFDESRFAAMAAEAIGSKHATQIFGDAEAQDLVLRIPDVLDEPMGDPSIFPTYLLSAFTRDHVTVALGGDGSDELLMGYRSFVPMKLSWGLPSAVRVPAAVAARALGRRPSRLRGTDFVRSLDRDVHDRLFALLGSFHGDARWVLSPEVRSSLGTETPFPIRGERLSSGNERNDPASQAVLAYLDGYLQEDILVKVDRASMANSLEVRSPFLDPAVVDFLLSLPAELKLKGLDGKYLLKRLMQDRLPPEIISRRKMGFGVPLDQWLRGPLHDLLLDHLDPRRIAADGAFDPSVVEQLVREHMAGCNHGRKLWLLLQYELWRERWLVGGRRAGLKPIEVSFVN